MVNAVITVAPQEGGAGNQAASAGSGRQAGGSDFAELLCSAGAAVKETGRSTADGVTSGQAETDAQAADGAVDIAAAAVIAAEAAAMLVAWPMSAEMPMDIQDGAQSAVTVGDVAVHARDTDWASAWTSGNGQQDADPFGLSGFDSARAVDGTPGAFGPGAQASVGDASDPFAAQAEAWVRGDNAARKRADGEAPAGLFGGSTGMQAGHADSAARGSHIPIESTPVEWQLDPAAQSHRFGGVQANAAGEAVAAGMPETGTSGGNDASASGRGQAPGAGLDAGLLGSLQGPEFSGIIREAMDRPVEPTEGLQTQAHTRVIDQMVKEVSLQRFDGRTDLLVRLDPPELGVLRVRVTQDATGVTSQIHASSDQVRSLLQAHLPALSDALSNAGLRVDSVSVAHDPSFGGMAHNAPNGHAYGQQGEHGRHPAFGRGRHMGTGATLEGAAMVSLQTDQAGYNWLA